SCADGTRGFGLSPRAPMMERVCGESTTHARAIFTTGRGAYARRGWIRLHVIAAGATLSPWAVALRHGGTALILTMVLRGCALPPALELSNPIVALHQVGRHPTAKIATSGGDATPLAILSRLHDWIAEEHRRRPLAPWADRLLAEWRLGLALAEADIDAGEIWLEYALRRRILGLYMAEAGIEWQEVRFWFHFLRLAERFRVPSIELPQTQSGERLRASIREEYQPILDERLIQAGRHWNELPIYRRHLQRLWTLDIELNRIADGIADRQSAMRRSVGAEVISEEAIARAELEPPDPTRARVRAAMIREHQGDRALGASWDLVRTSQGKFTLPTPLIRKPKPARAASLSTPHPVPAQ
ncbi:MAG TPA: proteasome accessory factor PafA2 family protein, partial [Candidatus Udaeobacter sp.]|nr:proteasome accessory factor PafA2 family protein [Candidatus Udaeobacter sp.]